MFCYMFSISSIGFWPGCTLMFQVVSLFVSGEFLLCVFLAFLKIEIFMFNSCSCLSDVALAIVLLLRWLTLKAFGWSYGRLFPTSSELAIVPTCSAYSFLSTITIMRPWSAGRTFIYGFRKNFPGFEVIVACLLVSSEIPATLRVLKLKYCPVITSSFPSWITTRRYRIAIHALHYAVVPLHTSFHVVLIAEFAFRS